MRVSETESNGERPSLHVMLPLVLVRSVFGFSVGLYLYNYGPVISEQFAVGTANGDGSFYGLNSLQWTAAVFSCGILMEIFLEVPTGVVGDEFGRKLAVLLALVSRVAYFVSLTALCFVSSFTWVLVLSLIAVFCFAVSYTLYSGTFVAWVNDALGEEGKVEQLSWALAYAQIYYWTFFLVGCLVGIWLWRTGNVFVSYLIGAGACLACTLVCAIYMKENQGYTFSSWQGVLRPRRWKLLTRYQAILRVGTRLFWKNRSLITLFLVQATALSLIYVVDFAWPIFIDDRFGQVLQARFSIQWVGLIAAFTLPILIGSVFIERWLSKRQNRKHLNQLAMISYVLFASPIFIVAWLTSSNTESLTIFWMFVGIMGVHKFFHGTIDTPMEAMQNACIPERTQERATTLSWGTLVRGLPVAILSFIGIGSSSNSLSQWLIPASAVLIGAVVLGVLFYLSPLEDGANEKAKTIAGDPK